jgi:hypothetical protein
VLLVSALATAALFPGQGSQTSDLRDGVQRVAPALLAECIALVSENPFARVSESTRFAQPGAQRHSIYGAAVR